jgi:TRAP-type C4-dicarboxylate transport system permease small subunit
MLKMFLLSAISAPAALGGPASFTELARIVTNALLGIAGSLSVIFLIVGGIMYTTSAGNENNTKKAKSTITGAIVGLIICVMAFAIVNFVLTTFK